MKIVDVLKKAKQELISRGRTAGVLIDDTGCVCALGAVGVVVVGEEPMRDADYRAFEFEGEAAHVVAALADATGYQVRSAVGAVFCFNDNHKPGNDQPILDLFDKAIAAQEED